MTRPGSVAIRHHLHYHFLFVPVTIASPSWWPPPDHLVQERQPTTNGSQVLRDLLLINVAIGVVTGSCRSSSSA